jgi:hypothetical protein
MKGRRKARTEKWKIMAQFVKAARAVIATRAETGGYFLRAAAQTTLEEPVGLLAGGRHALRTPRGNLNPTG